MSYDLMVFDPTVAPRERAAFMDWYESSPFEDDSDIFNDPGSCSSNLRSWYEAIVKEFPDYNGDNFDDEKIDAVGDRAAGYAIGSAAIYVDFRWSIADEAYDIVRKLAVEHKVGFYDVSGDEGDGEIYFPGEEQLEASTGVWRQISADFKSGDVSKYVSQTGAPKRRWWQIFRRNQ